MLGLGLGACLGTRSRRRRGLTGAPEGPTPVRHSAKEPANNRVHARCPRRTPRARTFALGPSRDLGPLANASPRLSPRPSSRRGEPAGSSDTACGQVVGSLRDQRLTHSYAKQIRKALNAAMRQDPRTAVAFTRTLK